jgi:putative ABC transport system ATP-binding protein
MNPAQGPVFTLQQLCKSYGTSPAAVHALRGINLDIDAGELLVLLGPSGSGKSTLLNILGGLDRPTSGTARFGDLDLTTALDDALTEYRRRHVGFVFQFYNLIASLTARENVELVSQIADDPMSPDEALRLVGLNERSTHFPAQLSGGEQQRVAIARAIVKRPTVLLCDEPTGALDVATGVKVLESLLHVNETIGTTTLLITHNADIARIGDRVVHFADGMIRNVEVNARRVAPSQVRW